MVLRLIMRRPGSTLALPRDGAEILSNTEEIPWYFAAEVMDYARIMKGSEDYMKEQYEDEVDELTQQEKEDELMFGEDAQWTRKAVASIHEAIEKLKGIGNPPSAPKQPNVRKPRRPPIEYRTDTEDVPGYYAIQHAKNSGQSSSRASIITQYERSGSSVDISQRSTSANPERKSVADLHASNKDIAGSMRSQSAELTGSEIQGSVSIQPRDRSMAASHNMYSVSPIFFYEALLHFYLSPLDIRILKAAFGDYSAFPATILPRVEHISTGHIVDDDLRKRAKYLAHLPHGCEVGFLECNWTDVVSPDILERFSSEIERRRKKNQEKSVKEEKERVRAEKEEDDKRWASARRKRPSMSHDVASEREFRPLSETSAVDIESVSSSPPWSSSRAQQGSAFASLASPSTSPVVSKTVWGTRIVAPSTPPMPATSQENDIPENDGWLHGWESDLFHEDDLIAQAEAMSMEAGTSKQAVPNGVSKKKKGKKITLMSTNVRRGA